MARLSQISPAPPGSASSPIPDAATASDPVPLPRPLDYMTREAADVLPEALDGFGFRRGVLLGHSDGASIAALYLGNIADHRVRGLILMAPHFFTEAVGLDAIAKARVAYREGDLRARLARITAMSTSAFRGWNDAWLDPGFQRMEHRGLPSTICAFRCSRSRASATNTARSRRSARW